jgi:hypothetical protein
MNNLLNLDSDTVYLAGPMRGKTLYNFPLFFKAGMVLRRKFNLDVLNPAERDMAVGFDPSEALDWPANAEVWTMGTAFAWDFAAIRKSSAIILLPNWQDSQGVQSELILSSTLGLRTFEYDPADETLTEIEIVDKTVSFVTKDMAGTWVGAEEAVTL